MWKVHVQLQVVVVDVVVAFAVVVAVFFAVVAAGFVVVVVAVLFVVAVDVAGPAIVWSFPWFLSSLLSPAQAAIRLPFQPFLPSD